MRTRLITAGAVLLVLATGACAGGGAPGDIDPGTATPTSSVIDRLESPPAAIDPSLSPLADLVRPGGRLVPPDQAADAAPTPLTLDIPTIRVQGAPIRPVGVLDNGELEVPGGREVGWYRWSASPGRSGSAVLAAHIAYNGSDGVFRRLDQLEPGDEITVRYEDGDEGRFVVSEKAQYAKDELPADRVFAREGSPLLTLITCGGSFNPDLRSYDDNVVVYAIPV